METLEPIVVGELKRRANLIRQHIIAMSVASQAAHQGGALSCADIMAVLYFHHMNVDPARPDWPDRDRFVLSKGHACLALYSALSQRGFFPEEELLTFDRIDSRLQGHPDMRKTPGVEMSTGCLAVAEVLGEQCPVPMCRVGVPDVFGESGADDDLTEKYGLSVRHIVEAARQVLSVRARYQP